MIGAAPRRRAACLLVLLSLAGGGCRSALLEKATPLPVRYYAPSERALAREAIAGRALDVPLRLGPVSAAAHLDVRMVSRRHNELEFHDALRWSERPEQYLQRGLAHALFEEQGLSPAVSGRAFTLEARLLSFEKAVVDRDPTALVTIVWTLHDERLAMLHETLRCTRPLSARSGLEGEALAAALSQALDECVDRIARQVVDTLRARLSAEAARH